MVALVNHEHLFIVQTPLYRISKNPKLGQRVYSEQEEEALPRKTFIQARLKSVRNLDVWTKNL